MLMIDINKVKKSYGDRLILDIESLKFYRGDRIGLVGRNGSGKSTLLKLLAKIEEEDEGRIELRGDYSYVSQLGGPEGMKIDGEMASRFRLGESWSPSLSGGEKTRYKLAEALASSRDILLLDEPSNNLDLDGIDLIKKELEAYSGLLLLVSHDRALLDALTNQTLEIEDGRLRLYQGNYTSYRSIKEDELEKDRHDYDRYIRERKRLEKAALEISRRSDGLRRTPKRMGNSEARLHRMGGQTAKKTLDQGKRSIKTRLDRLEVQEKPREEKAMTFDILEDSQIYSQVLLRGRDINLSFGDMVLFREAAFEIYRGSKVGLIGENGSGKTSLLRMTMDTKEIERAAGLKIGYFSQDMDGLDDGKTILENVMGDRYSVEESARLLLARFLFRGDMVYQKVGKLSGGERLKVSLAQVLFEDTNMLILDEPTNHLDLSTVEVLENSLRDCDKTILLVSHDRVFLSSLVDEILYIEKGDLHRFIGGYEAYLNRKDKKVFPNQDQIILLENRLNNIIGSLSMGNKNDNMDELNQEYASLLKKLKNLKKD